MSKMMNVCQKCGIYDVAKKIHAPITQTLNQWAYAECLHCGHMHKFRRLPLFVVCGASGTGKTVVCLELSQKASLFIPLEGDILWCPAFNKPNNNFRDFFEIWLRMAKNIGQIGRPVVLFSAGAGVTGNIQNCVERRYFSTVNYLALVCENACIEERLRKRPDWRNCNETFIQSQKDLNQCYRETGPNLDPPMTSVDTSTISVSDITASVNSWILSNLTESI